VSRVRKGATWALSLWKGATTVRLFMEAQSRSCSIAISDLSAGGMG
jgi:hypothetical protein